VIVGEDGDAADALRARVDAAGLGDAVRFLGAQPQDRLPQHYRWADVFVLPCRVMDDGDRDGIPNVLMEAMVFGLPVVTTPVSGIPELVEHDVNGLLVAPGDAAAVAGAIERAADDPLLRRRIAATARRTVVTRFDAEAMAARLVALFGHPAPAGASASPGEVTGTRADAPVAR
jgi:glycosyltransferase involved in cell wall biosynthesis